MSKAGAVRLRAMLERNHDIALRTADASFPTAAFEALQGWQSRRIAHSFADLLEHPGYAEAGHFFLSELYGGEDFRQRDQDIGRVMPVMIRFLPDRVLYSMSEAFELQAISLEYDMAMAGWIHAHDALPLDTGRYREAYVAGSDPAGRTRQIELIRTLGNDLDRLVHKPLVNYLVRLLHGPAHTAGFGALQDFLERGLQSFRALPDAAYFVDTIHRREMASMKRLFADDPDPFRLDGAVA
jgi:hypothetical protein